VAAGARLVTTRCRAPARLRLPRHPSQVRALAATSLAKAAALAVLGRWLVPGLPFSEGFLEAEGSLAVLQAARGSGVPVFAIGGYGSLAGIEKALDTGFSGVQMARALIRDPYLLKRFRQAAAEEVSRSRGATVCDGDTDGAPLRKIVLQVLQVKVAAPPAQASK